MRRLAGLVIASLTVLTAAPQLAHAEGAEEGTLERLPSTSAPAATGIIADTLYFRNGAVLRGTVYEILPGDHVTFLEPSGQIKTFRWTEIDRVELGYRPAGATPPPAVGATSVPKPMPEKRGPMVRVHIASKKTVQLYRQPVSSGEWHEACSSPCDEDMPLGDEYRISGAGIFQSKDFQLEGSPGGQVVLNIDPGTRSSVVLGGVVAAVGGLVDYFSLVAFAAGAASTSSCYGSSSYTSSSYSSTCTHESNSGTAVGFGMLAVGTGMMVTGTIIMLSNSSTGVSQDQSSKTSARALDAYRREAIWHAPSAVERIGAPAAFSFPILNRTF